MKSKIKEEIRPFDEARPQKIKTPKGRRRKKNPFLEEKVPNENDAALSDAKRTVSFQKRPETNELANVKCMECNCVGTVMKSIDGIVLFPNKVKKTLLDLGGGLFMPNLRKMKPVETLSFASKRVQKFVDGFTQVVDNEEDEGRDSLFKRSLGKTQKLRERFVRGIENAKNEKRMEIVRMMEVLDREKTKTPAKDVPERFTGFFSDEFEEDKFWKSKKRFSLQ